MFVPTKKENTPAISKKNIYDLLGNRILACKKDIACKEGVFKKHASVFPVIVNYRVSALCDLRDWSGDYDPAKSCPVGTVEEKITSLNFAEFFEVNKEASKQYLDVSIQGMNIRDKKEVINNFISNGISRSAIIFCCGVLGLFFIDSEHLFGFAAIMISIFALNLLGMLLAYIVAHRKINKMIADYNVSKEKLREYIENTERYSGYDDEYFTASKKLIELANKQAGDN